MRNEPNRLQVIGICAYGSGAGKTTLLVRLLPALQAQGLRVSVIKHAHHKFDIDHPGKDSYKIREAGAVQTLVASSKRWALMTESADEHANNALPELDYLLAQLDTSMADLVLVEGYREADIPKIEIFRHALGYPLLASGDSHIIAIACDNPVDCHQPQLDLNQPEQIASFILSWLQARTS